MLEVDTKRMKAFTKLKYGGPEVLHLTEVEKPKLQDKHLLVKVMANSANPADWHILRGKPYLARLTFGLFKPKNKILGADFSGVVEEVGPNITGFKKGDWVFGEALTGGAFAEYICVPDRVCALLPKKVDFTKMACVPLAGITALQAIISHGQLKAGESICINGASGGVGHFAVQIAKNQGAKVTAVCSSKNVDFVKGLGADFVIPYDKENIHKHQLKYDLVVDVHGNLFHSDYKRMGKRGVVVGFTSMTKMILLLLKSSFSKFPLTQFTAKANSKDLAHLAVLVAQSEIQVYIDKTYPYSKIPEAIKYIENMRTKGKVAMTWENV